MTDLSPWDAKNLRMIQAHSVYGPEATVLVQTAFHLSADYHAALNRLHERLGYDPALRSEIERFGMTANR